KEVVSAGLGASTGPYVHAQLTPSRKGRPVKAPQGMTVDQGMDAVGDASRDRIGRHRGDMGRMAQRMLEMTEMRLRPEHEVWQPEEQPEPGPHPQPEDPAVVFADQCTTLTGPERIMLRYALDQAQENIWSEGGFTDEDQAALTSLLRLTDEGHNVSSRV